MKYRIIEETDGAGVSVFYAQYQVKNWMGRVVWKDVCTSDWGCGDVVMYYPRRFDSPTEARTFLKKWYAPKVNKIIEEGDL